MPRDLRFRRASFNHDTKQGCASRPESCGRRPSSQRAEDRPTDRQHRAPSRPAPAGGSDTREGLATNAWEGAEGAAAGAASIASVSPRPEDASSGRGAGRSPPAGSHAEGPTAGALRLWGVCPPRRGPPPSHRDPRPSRTIRGLTKKLPGHCVEAAADGNLSQGCPSLRTRKGRAVSRSSCPHWLFALSGKVQSPGDRCSSSSGPLGAAARAAVRGRAGEDSAIRPDRVPASSRKLSLLIIQISANCFPNPGFEHPVVALLFQVTR